MSFAENLLKPQHFFNPLKFRFKQISVFNYTPTSLI